MKPQAAITISKSMPAGSKRFFTQAPCIAIALISVFFCFLYGINSDFLFDDFPNLGALIHLQDQSMFSPGFWEFVRDGQAGPTGRPVSLFTFALQADSWPDNPAAFKGINLVIHCFNTLLIFLICRQLSTVLKLDNANTMLFCLFASLIWALHPIHTTVVFYAVQRMALLSNCFILLGVYFHLRIRLANFSSNPLRQAIWLSISLIITGLLALFSKENAPSLIFYLLVLEYTLLITLPRNPIFIKWRIIFLWLPALMTLLLTVVFMGYIEDSFQSFYSYTASQRLLTESRILWQYLGVILAPSTSGTSLFHNIQVSTSILSPMTTLVSIIAWISLLVLAMLKPGKNRIFLFALLWFFAGHVIESTVLPLELYFNHRNYLALLGPVIAIMFALYSLVSNSKLSPRIKPALCILYLCMLAFQTIGISSLWRNPIALSENWYLADPDTSRNAEFYAITLADQDFEGKLQAAVLYEQAYARDPANFRHLLNRMMLSCTTSFISPVEESAILDGLAKINRESRDLLSPLQQLVTLTVGNQCNIYSPGLLAEVLENIMENDASRAGGFYRFELARLKTYTGENDQALSFLETAYDMTGDSGILFTLALHLINLDRFEEALVTIDKAIDRLQSYNNIRTGTRESKLALLYEMRSDVTGFIDTSNQQ